MCFHNIFCLFVCISSSAVVWLLCAILFIPFDELDFLFMGVFSVLFLQTSAALHLSPLSRKIWKHIFLTNSWFVNYFFYTVWLLSGWRKWRPFLRFLLLLVFGWFCFSCHFCFWRYSVLYWEYLHRSVNISRLNADTAFLPGHPINEHGSEPQCKWSPYKFWFK